MPYYELGPLISPLHENAENNSKRSSIMLTKTMEKMIAKLINIHVSTFNEMTLQPFNHFPHTTSKHQMTDSSRIIWAYSINETISIEHSVAK